MPITDFTQSSQILIRYDLRKSWPDCQAESAGQMVMPNRSCPLPGGLACHPELVFV